MRKFSSGASGNRPKLALLGLRAFSWLTEEMA